MAYTRLPTGSGLKTFFQTSAANLANNPTTPATIPAGVSTGDTVIEKTADCHEIHWTKTAGGWNRDWVSLKTTQRSWDSGQGWGGNFLPWNNATFSAVNNVYIIPELTGRSFTLPPVAPAIQDCKTQDVVFKFHLCVTHVIRATTAQYNAATTAGMDDWEVLATPVIRFNGGAWQSILPGYFAYTNFASRDIDQTRAFHIHLNDSDKSGYYRYPAMPTGNYTIDVGLRWDYLGSGWTSATHPLTTKELRIWEQAMEATIHSTI